jgi:glyoxylase-like metal-dependent hydrolase (beta-lactamase superfamily II)
MPTAWNFPSSPAYLPTRRPTQRSAVAFAFLGRFISRETIYLGKEWARKLPAGEEVPGVPNWGWIYTPGHVCLFRPEDRVLLAGDALTTVDADPFSGMLGRRKKITRPATPVTPDWYTAERSVREMASLRPRELVT